jgi:transposase
LKLAEDRKSLTPGKASRKRSKLNENGIKLLEEDLHPRPTVTCQKRADLLHELLGVRVSKATHCRAIRRLGYNRRKDGEFLRPWCSRRLALAM